MSINTPMTIPNYLKNAAFVLIATAWTTPTFAGFLNENPGDSTKTAATRVDQKDEKVLYIPADVYRVPKGNDYNNEDSEYSYKRMVQSDNVAILWAKEFGENPSENTEAKSFFEPDRLLEEAERIYDYYVNDLRLVYKGTSWSDKYKILIFIISGEEGTAFGGGEENKIGILWSPPSRVSKAPYGALAHELGHSFQYISSADMGSGSRSAIVEMMAQYVLWQVYPDWMTFENYHLVSFMDKTHFAFLHGTNMYHSPYVLEYWSNKHGLDFISKLWKNGQPGEDPVMAYKRLTAINQEQFNDEIFDAYRRFMTWDLPRVSEIAKPYANGHHTKMKSVADGWLQIADEKIPQNYGYNGIELEVPTSSDSITLDFKGIAGAEGFTNVKTDKAGWRYGFVAVSKDGLPRYSPIQKTSIGHVTYRIPENTDRLWLVVMGAPTEHWPVAGRMRRGQDEPAPKEEQWPYQIKLTGTTVVAKILQE